MLLFKYTTLFLAGIWFLLKSLVVTIRYNFNPFSPIFADEDWIYRWKKDGREVDSLPPSLIYQFLDWNDTAWKRFSGKGDRKASVWETAYCWLSIMAGALLTLAFLYLFWVFAWIVEMERMEG